MFFNIGRIVRLNPGQWRKNPRHENTGKGRVTEGKQEPRRTQKGDWRGSRPKRADSVDLSIRFGASQVGAA